MKFQTFIILFFMAMGICGYVFAAPMITDEGPTGLPLEVESPSGEIWKK